MKGYLHPFLPVQNKNQPTQSKIALKEEKNAKFIRVNSPNIFFKYVSSKYLRKSYQEANFERA